MAQTAAHLVEQVIPWGRRANGSCRCLFPCSIGWLRPRSSPRRFIPSSAPRLGSIMCTRRSHAASHGPRSNRGRWPLSSVLAVRSMWWCLHHTPPY